LERSAIAVDERDEALGKRFFPAGVKEHLKKEKDPKYWYDISQYYEVSQGNLSCCSDTPASFHYIPPREMFMLEYLTRYVHPFGLDKSSSESLPRKLKLKEILYKSDVESKSIKYKKHRIYHDLEDSEKYRRRRRRSA
jgi:glycoprotein-N-acetylgalactosamine 3-beta-galactosyltransferase